ncbi:MAG TPA: hypothetical protein VGB29_02110 [Thermodesulfobacteriota bacterium]|jgi:hypothetical protein
MQELLDVFTGFGTQLGFASTGIAYAYIGSILASLLCVFYGLVLWVRGKIATRVQRWQKRRPVRKGRGLRWRRWH